MKKVKSRLRLLLCAAKTYAAIIWMIRVFFMGLIATGLLLLPGCAPAVKKAAFAPSLQGPQDAAPAPAAFSGLKIKIPTGTDVGYIGSEGLISCAWPYVPAGRSLVRAAVDRSDLKDIFHDTLEAQGYDITGSLDFEFPEDFEDDDLRSEYRIGASVRDISIVACHRAPDALGLLLGAQEGYIGEMHIALDWLVFDALRRTRVYKTTTEGYARQKTPHEDGITLLMNDAFEMAAHNLGADAAFHELLFSGRKPAVSGLEKDRPDRPRKFDVAETVTLPALPLSAVPFETWSDTARRGTVMIESGAGHGSGFFITGQGHILTNAHVVGDALRVRVTLADKKDALPAEVLRKDNARDVALLRLEDMPDSLAPVILPLRRDWPAVGDTVYAVGAPVLRRLQDTVRQGIISAHRRDYKFLGSRQDLIQADVPTQPGNSGGPLLDRNGNVIGLAHGGFFGADEVTDLSLNMFVPVETAVRTLKLEELE